jgi:lipopolysaccharide export system permease protein
MSIVGRYILGQYLRVLALTMVAATALFLVVDAADRVTSYSQYTPTAGSLLRYYVFRLPRILTDVYPAVSLLSVLLSLGLLERRRELMALRACGVGPWQMSAPLIAAGLLVSIAAFLWGETVVPPTAAEARRTREVVIKKRRDFRLLDAHSIWFQNREGFVNIDYFDASQETLHGLHLYVADDFRLRRIVEVPFASWRDGAWHMAEGTVKEFDAAGRVTARALGTDDIRFLEDPNDLAKHRPNPEELTLAAVRDRIKVVEARGLDASELRVDLHAKFALPLAGLVSVLVGFPLAARGGRRFGLARNVSLGLIAGFAYWVTMAVAVAAGRTGMLPPAVAAWSPDIIFGGTGALLYAWSER